ncbi:thiolase family protein [Conexibacter sp. CPCC 206217]|uniref:thiolase family protein n=1 Tax=Conexibacter sp. CPCC 206217 TaxID=3064574 RepID=UPI00271726FD|nr:thiolase family protein [Conexibacter sp. CPCC 206217]MDO8212592.1 thiolase family protein [Conexibacter sp. CPCC 206217]
MAQGLQEAVIVEAVRTPVGRGHREKGIFRDVHPAVLLGGCYSALFARSGVDPETVDHAICGCVYQIAEQSAGITRNAWLQEGLPERTAATTVDVRCGSGQQAVNLAALRIATGVDDVVVAGGVEHMGRVGFPVNLGAQEQWGQAFTPQLLERYALVPQGEGAELIADRWGISREEMDALSAESHRRAAAATDSGAFARELLPTVGSGATQTADQGIRPSTTPEILAGLKPAFRPDGRVTAGNSSQISDGAAALLLTSAAKARALGVRPRARIVDQVVLGVDPITMLTGPIPATAKILERNGLTIGDLDAIEINEAFASVVLAWEREHRPDMARVNPRGGAIAIGHPLGSTGARLITTLLHELEDLDGELGLVTMCCAGGIGTATLIQRL